LTLTRASLRRLLPVDLSDLIHDVLRMRLESGVSVAICGGLIFVLLPVRTAGHGLNHGPARDSFVPRGLLTAKEVDISDGPCGHVTEGSFVPCAKLIS